MLPGRLDLDQKNRAGQHGGVRRIGNGVVAAVPAAITAALIVFAGRRQSLTEAIGRRIDPVDPSGRGGSKHERKTNQPLPNAYLSHGQKLRPMQPRPAATTGTLRKTAACGSKRAIPYRR